MAEKLKKTGAHVKGIHPEVLKSLVAQCNGMKAEMDEARGELGAAVKNAEDTHGVNRKAFKLVLSMLRMEPAAKDDFLNSVIDYSQKLGLAPQGDLFAVPPAEEGPTAEKNAAALKGGIKQLDAGVH